MRDDLLEIQREHQMDDSTLDDFDDLLATHNTARMPTPPPDDNSAEQSPVRARELEAYRRMSRSLKTGLLGIQTAKKGIERLEDKVSHSEALTQTDHPETPPQPDHHVHHHHQQDTGPGACSLCAERPPSTTVAYVHMPVPRLYYREPTFRLSCWVSCSSCARRGTWPRAPCALTTAGPPTASGGQDCIWSPDDPFFGCAIPVKLDQWATGGQGRLLASGFLEGGERPAGGRVGLCHGHRHHPGGHQVPDLRAEAPAQAAAPQEGPGKDVQGQPEQNAKLEAWRAARKARERARGARDMGYDIGDGLGTSGWLETRRYLVGKKENNRARHAFCVR